MRKSALVFVFSVISTTLYAQTLKTSVQHALISNPDILLNRAKTLAAGQAVKGAEGNYLPSVDIKLGIGREQTDTPITKQLGGSSSNEPMTRKESSIELMQSVFSGYGITGEVKRQYYLWRAQQFKTLGIAEDLSLSVTEVYLDVLKNQQLLMLARENLAEHERLFKMIESRAGAGVSRQAELEQAKGRLALANANYLSVENDLRDSRVSFMRIIGEPAHHLLWPKVPSATHLPRSLPVALQKGLDNHPTLLSAYADIMEAKAQHVVAKANDYPKLDILVRFAQNRNLDGLLGQNNERLGMLRLSYNLYRGGADQAKKRETAYQVQEAYEVKNNSILQVEEKVRLSWYAWITAGERLEYLDSHVTSAYETRLAYAEQFKVGKRTFLDLLDSQNEYYQSQIEKEKGSFDEVFTRYRILNSIGSLFPFLEGQLPTSVHNSDFANSHERINHAWLNKPLDAIPDVDLDNQKLKDQDLSVVKHPNIKKHKVHTTTNALHDIYQNTWYVYAKKFASPQAAASLSARLKRMGMKASWSKAKRASWVYLGPFEFRSQAGLAMKQLQKRAKIKGSVALRQRKLPPVNMNSPYAPQQTKVWQVSPIKVPFLGKLFTKLPHKISSHNSALVQKNVQNVHVAKRKLKNKELAVIEHAKSQKQNGPKTENTSRDVYKKTWYVYAKKFGTPQPAEHFATRLTHMGMKASSAKTKDATWVYLGPFYIHSEASLAMKQLEQRTKIKGSIALRQKKSSHENVRFPHASVRDNLPNRLLAKLQHTPSTSKVSLPQKNAKPNKHA